ncbi:MAG: hypothetical protein MUC42_17155 [Bryobacter sp.]|nr:hypothetical protein [Bryobacter sp.]
MNSDQANRGRGCFFYGCLTAVVLVVVAAVGGYFGIRYYVNKLVNTYTDTAPLAIPTVETTQAEADALLEKVRTFKTALAGGTAEPLAIGTKELNTLIAFSPDFKDLKGKAYVAVEDDKLRGQISLPLDGLPLVGAKGRYLNGEAALKASLENGVLMVTLDSLKIKGQDAPSEVIAAFQKQNLAKDAYQNPDPAKVLSQMESISIKDGAMTIKPRAKTGGQ